MDNVNLLLPSPWPGLILTIILTFLLGLERERSHGNAVISFGGIRTFPLIGLFGFLTLTIGPSPGLTFVAGLILTCAVLLIWYQYRLRTVNDPGSTSVFAAILTYLIGGLLAQGLLREGIAVTVAMLLLLEHKSQLENLALRFNRNELGTLTTFLLIAAVVLPAVPNESFTKFDLNPYRIWLIVVTVSGISYLTYLLGKIVKGTNALLFSSLIAGAYSSTQVTVLLAKRSNVETKGLGITGAMILASGVMYPRILLLIALFNQALFQHLLAPFLVNAAIFFVVGGLLLLHDRRSSSTSAGTTTHNPLELRTAFIFAFLFTLMGILTRYIHERFGESGLFTLAGFSGLSDVDPFVMGLTGTSSSMPPLASAAKAIIIATASNNFLKGMYAYSFGAGSVRKHGPLFMLALALISGLGFFMV